MIHTIFITLDLLVNVLEWNTEILLLYSFNIDTCHIRHPMDLEIAQYFQRKQILIGSQRDYNNESSKFPTICMYFSLIFEQHHSHFSSILYNVTK